MCPPDKRPDKSALPVRISNLIPEEGMEEALEERLRKHWRNTLRTAPFAPPMRRKPLFYRRLDLGQEDPRTLAGDVHETLAYRNLLQHWHQVYRVGEIVVVQRDFGLQQVLHQP